MGVSKKTRPTRSRHSEAAARAAHGRVAYRVLISIEQLDTLRQIKRRTGESVQPMIRRAVDAVIRAKETNEDLIARNFGVQHLDDIMRPERARKRGA